MNTAFPLLEFWVLLFGDVVFALSILKGDEGKLVIFRGALNRVDKIATDGLYHARGSPFVPAVDANELWQNAAGLDWTRLESAIKCGGQLQSDRVLQHGKEVAIPAETKQEEQV